MPIACPLCQEQRARTLSVVHHDQGITYQLHQCDACLVQFWTPFKNPGAAWYEHDERYATRNLDPILTANKKQQDVLTFLKKKSGTLLDVGCGVGNFLAFARTQGWEGWGIDFDHDAIDAGTRVFGLSNLSVADLRSFVEAHPNLRFDLVTFFDVFEHIDNHNEFLELISGILTPSGSLALSVPYRHGWRWLLPADLPPRHLTRWDEESLDRTLARHGFHITRRWRLPANLYYLIMKLRFRYGRWASFGLVQKMRRSEGDTTVSSGPVPSRVRGAQILAKVKDVAIFGLPALLLWLILLPQRKRYTDMYVVASKQ